MELEAWTDNSLHSASVGSHPTWVWYICCIFWPAFGCCALQTLVEIVFFNVFAVFYGRGPDLGLANKARFQCLIFSFFTSNSSSSNWRISNMFWVVIACRDTPPYLAASLTSIIDLCKKMFNKKFPTFFMNVCIVSLGPFSAPKQKFVKLSNKLDHFINNVV